MKTLKTEVLVIGSGGAGLRAAVSAADEGAQVLMVCKGRVNRSGSTLLAGANVSADVMCDGRSMASMNIGIGDENDSKEAFFRDIILEGMYLGDRKLVKQYVENAPQVIREIVENNSNLHPKGDDREIGIPGSTIIDTYYKILKERKVEVIEDSALLDLLKAKDGTIGGALFLDLIHGEIFAVNAAATLLATGGMHNCYDFTSGTTGLAGEGQAAAIRAGAEMTDMEMVTFCAGVITHPLKWRGSILPYIIHTNDWFRLKNRDGEEFMEKHLPRSAVDLALHSEWNKMLLCYAMYKEVNDERKGDEYGGVTFDLEFKDEADEQAFMDHYPFLKTGTCNEMIKYLKDNGGMPVYGAAHYFDGGISIDETFRTTLEGLFAAGECTGGTFGANRVSAATTQMLVQGLEAGKTAAAYAKKAGLKELCPACLEEAEKDALRPFENKGKGNPRRLKKTVSAIISRSAGIVRREDQMASGLKDLEALDLDSWGVTIDTPQYNRSWMDWLEARSMITCGLGILRSSLARKESRGVFIRSDCFYTDNDEYLKTTRYKDGKVWLEPVEQGEIAAPAGRTDYIESVEAVIKRLSYSS
ncbi:MAG: FAD-binding protein [Firmicutes bacterium]|nr:FAD-binding protein [Bacillota bacterium]